MKKWVKFLLAGVGVLIVLVAGVLAYVKFILPDVGPPPALTIQATKAQIEHGKYLATHVAVCMDCHSERDISRLSMPVMAGTEGKGGEEFTRKLGFPGNYYGANITPASLGSWTDGEIYRAITSGVSRDGRALFPVMPYEHYAHMDTRDIYDIIAYVRTMKPIAHEVPAAESDFPMNFIINTIPLNASPGTCPDTTDELAYGKYLVTFASCDHCHTPTDAQGAPLPGMTMAGGREFPGPAGTMRSMNITPHTSGIGSWTKEDFVARFKQYNSPGRVGAGEFNSLMPWASFAGMSEHDLGAMYTYLRTLKPVDHRVVRFTPTNAVAER